MKKTIYNSPELLVQEFCTTILQSSIGIGFSKFKLDDSNSSFFSGSEN